MLWVSILSWKVMFFCLEEKKGNTKTRLIDKKNSIQKQSLESRPHICCHMTLCVGLWIYLWTYDLHNIILKRTVKTISMAIPTNTYRHISLKTTIPIHRYQQLFTFLMSIVFCFFNVIFQSYSEWIQNKNFLFLLLEKGISSSSIHEIFCLFSVAKSCTYWSRFEKMDLTLIYAMNWYP